MQSYQYPQQKTFNAPTTLLDKLIDETAEDIVLNHATLRRLLKRKCESMGCSHLVRVGD